MPPTAHRSAPLLLILLAGCAKILGADFDRPFQESSSTGTGGAGGSPGTTASTSGSTTTSGTGGTSATTGGSTTASGTGGMGTTATSGSSSSAGGGDSTSSGTGGGGGCAVCFDDQQGQQIPGLDATTANVGICKAGCLMAGKCVGAVGPKADDQNCAPAATDDDCNGIAGIGQACGFAGFYTLVKNENGCDGDEIVISPTTNQVQLPGFKPISGKWFLPSFKPVKPSDPLYQCKSAAGHYVLSYGVDCMAAMLSPPGLPLVDYLGYVYTTPVGGTEQLKQIELKSTGFFSYAPPSVLSASCCINNACLPLQLFAYK